MIAHLVAMAQRWPGSIVFLENYDMGLGRLLTRGCDVWLNNPLRPLEASGTSGMKAAMNGVLNLSILDGWWPEGCEHGVNGWAIGDGTDAGPAQDARDLAALYETLESEVLPAYADRATAGSRMMQAAIADGHRALLVGPDGARVLRPALHPGRGQPRAARAGRVAGTGGHFPFLVMTSASSCARPASRGFSRSRTRRASSIRPIST